MVCEICKHWIASSKFTNTHLFKNVQKNASIKGGKRQLSCKRCDSWAVRCLPSYPFCQSQAAKTENGLLFIHNLKLASKWARNKFETLSSSLKKKKTHCICMQIYMQCNRVLQRLLVTVVQNPLLPNSRGGSRYLRPAAQVTGCMIQPSNSLLHLKKRSISLSVCMPS